MCVLASNIRKFGKLVSRRLILHRLLRTSAVAAILFTFRSPFQATAAALELNRRKICHLLAKIPSKKVQICSWISLILCKRRIDELNGKCCDSHGKVKFMYFIFEEMKLYANKTMNNNRLHT